jgi:hypothetical protein
MGYGGFWPKKRALSLSPEAFKSTKIGKKLAKIANYAQAIFERFLDSLFHNWFKK